MVLAGHFCAIGFGNVQIFCAQKEIMCKDTVQDI